MSNNEFDPSTCPIGRVNEKSIKFMGEKLDMAITRLEEKMDDMKSDLTSHMNEGFTNINEKLDKVEVRMTSLENGLDERIEGKIKQSHNNSILKIVGWTFGSCGAAVVIAVATRFVLNLFHL
jgi:hypothetical protein|nr:MAG TPA_asm: Protein of unknown function (DUF1640) [Caudoviricetes sp.]